MELEGVTSGAGELALPGVLMLDQVDVVRLQDQDQTDCADLCRGECVRWDWQQATHSCILDHRQDLRGVRMEEEKVRKTTERRGKPRRKTSKPARRTTKRPTSSTTVTTTLSSTDTTEKSQRKTGGKRKSGQRKQPVHSTKGKTLIVSEEIAEPREEAQE